MLLSAFSLLPSALCRPPSVVGHPALLSLMALLLVTTASAASKLPLTTGRVLNPGEVLHAVPGALLGDTSYAEVNSASLPRLYRDFRDELFERGIMRRSDRFTCKHFAGLFAEMAQADFAREMHRSNSKARALAIGSIWYVRDDGAGPHAIVQALTERGRIYLEPQTGREISLSPREEASAYFRFF